MRWNEQAIRWAVAQITARRLQLTDRELGIIDSVQTRLAGDVPLTERQVAAVQRIWNRIVIA